MSVIFLSHLIARMHAQLIREGLHLLPLISVANNAIVRMTCFSGTEVQSHFASIIIKVRCTNSKQKQGKGECCQRLSLKSYNLHNY